MFALKPAVREGFLKGVNAFNAFLQAAAPSRMPPLALPAAGQEAGSRHERVGFAFPERPQPPWTSSMEVWILVH